MRNIKTNPELDRVEVSLILAVLVYKAMRSLFVPRAVGFELTKLDVFQRDDWFMYQIEKVINRDCVR